jgi:pimeloyl-ACP methyl ester carboxylesterase
VARGPPHHRHLLAASLRVPAAAVPRRRRGHRAHGRGLDFNDTEAIKTFLIANNRRLGTAGKVLFPIPDRKVAKRLYRITNPTLLVWGDDDRYVPQPYAEAWRAAIDGAELEIIPDAGHMAPYEQPGDVAGVIARFFGV